MHDLEQLPEALRKNLLRALESAVNVRHRGDLFLWFQGSLSALIEHRVVVMAGVLPREGVRSVDCLHAVPLSEPVLAGLRDPGGVLVQRMAGLCHEHGAGVVSLDADQAQLSPAVALVVAALDDLGVGPGLLHFTGQVLETGGLAIALLGLPAPARPDQKILLDVLAPQIHLATLRATHFGKQNVGAVPAKPRLTLTERQLEILHWVKMGKTNSEAATILGVSELTVKNHLQRVFRKLNVHSRAQAVAYLMSLDSGFA